MRCLILAALVPLLVAASGDPDVDPALIPPPIRAMVDAALETGNDADIATIVKYARAADPASGDAVQALAQHWHDQKVAANEARIRDARFLDLWSGKAELSGFITTGNSDTKGLTAAVNATREGILWRQKFRAQVDYQESLGIVTREHYLASYEPNYKIDARAYAYGQLQYESDRILGYYDRASASVGLGYSLFKTPAIQLDVELGPAYRFTRSTDDSERSSAAARGTVDFKWKLAPGISLSQNGSAYVERYNSTLASTTALSAKVFGPLAAQLSYNVQYESEPPVGSKTTDTATRLGLTYSF